VTETHAKIIIAGIVLVIIAAVVLMWRYGVDFRKTVGE
jgi:hypothetical protein